MQGTVGLLPAVHDRAYMVDGACRTHPPALFDTDTSWGRTPRRGNVVINGETMTFTERIEKARAVCTACPVLDDCAVYIKKHPEPEGMWAAMLPEERAS